MSNIQFSAPAKLFIGWYNLSPKEKKEVNTAMRKTLEQELKKRKKIQ